MDSLVPVATQSATQTLFVTTTGAEKVFTLIGLATVTILSLLGLLTIIKATIISNVKIKRLNSIVKN